MQFTVKMIHLLALGLWFGSVTFFSFFAALPIFHRLERLAEEKPAWLPGLQEKKQGTRLAGEALTPVFDRYFYLQMTCGVLALATALWWVNLPGTVHKLRVAILVLALLLVLGNALLLAPEVSELRKQRYSEQPEVFQRAEAAFYRWHTYSLVTDLVSWLLVMVALALAAALPGTAPEDGV